MQSGLLPHKLPRLESAMLCEWSEERDADGKVVARNLTSWSAHAFARHRAGRSHFRKTMIRVAGDGGVRWFDWMQTASYDQMATLWNTTALTLGYVTAGGVMVLATVCTVAGAA